MNTKAYAVYHAERVKNIWVNIGIVCLVLTISMAIYVWRLHTQLQLCYAIGSLH